MNDNEKTCHIPASALRLPDGSEEAAISGGLWEAVITRHGKPAYRVLVLPVTRRFLLDGQPGFPTLLPGETVTTGGV